MDQVIAALKDIGALDSSKNSALQNEIESPSSIQVFGGDQLDQKLRNQAKRTLYENWDVRDLPPLTTDEAGGIQTRGLELLAWYTPYHFDQSNWGITIRNRGVEIISHSLVHEGVPLSSANNIAEKALIAHELGHFQIENGVSLIEILGGIPYYVQRAKFYKTGWCNEEEALCNALAFESTSKHKKEISNFLDRGPAGYSDWRGHRKMFRNQSFSEVIGLRSVGHSIGPVTRLDLQSTKEFVKFTYVQDGSGPYGSILGT